MVEYVDGSVLAQLGNPDMRTPIAHGAGVSGAHRRRASSALDLARLGGADVRARPTSQRFPVPRAWPTTRCARAARRRAVLNAANEVAVAAFLAGTHPLHRISQRRCADVAARVAGRGAADSLDDAARARRRGAALRAPAGSPARLRGYSGAHDRRSLQVLAFLVTLGVLVVVHEFGHYRVARRVRRQGAALLGRLRPRAAGAASAAPTAPSGSSAPLPLGGYVKMLDEREGDGRAAELAPRLQPQASGSASRSSPPGRSPTCCSRSLLYAAAHWIGVDEPKAVLGAAGRRRASPSAPACAPATGCAPGRSDGDDWQDVRSLTDLRWQVTQAVLHGERRRAAWSATRDGRGQRRVAPRARVARRERGRRQD